jgi:hypothetical protein
MKRSTTNPTKAERARMDAIKEQGCVLARFLGVGWLPCEIHHLTLGGRHGAPRLGHMHTVGLNSWSHRGVPLDGWSSAKCREVLGPSYAREPRAFRELYPDARLLEMQHQLISK